MKRNSIARLRRRRMEKNSAKYTEKLTLIPRQSWPEETPPGLLKVYRSNRFLVQIYGAPLPALYRLSIHRTEQDATGNWRDNITWDELLSLKNQAGFQDSEAVEIYPPAGSVVNVANIRHLWVMGEPMGFSWRPLSPESE